MLIWDMRYVPKAVEWGNGVGEGRPGKPHCLKACVHLWARHLTKPYPDNTALLSSLLAFLTIQFQFAFKMVFAFSACLCGKYNIYLQAKQTCKQNIKKCDKHWHITETISGISPKGVKWISIG